MLKKERYNLMLNSLVVSIIDKMVTKSPFSRSDYINRILINYIEEMDERFKKNSGCGFCSFFGVSDEELSDLYDEF